MKSAVDMQRRGALKLLGAGGLLVAIPALAGGGADGTRATSGSAGAPSTVIGWVRIAADGSATVLSNTSEIGQGSGSAIAQILADELDLDWRAVRIDMAPVEARYINPGWEEYATYGSGGIKLQFDALRKAGAQARAMLVAAAANRWQLPAADCATEGGQVLHRASGRSLGYGELAPAAALLAPPADAQPKPKEAWRYIGKEVARFDLPAKVDGSAVYGIDVRLPGMLTATILQSPSFGGRLASVDPAPALALPGVRHVVPLDHAVAVVADSYWQAKKGLAALSPVWDLAQASKHNSPDYNAALLAAAQAGGDVFVRDKSTLAQTVAPYEAAQKSAVRSIEQTYTVPFLSHATMEPMNGTARVDAGSAELWLPTQAQSATREAVAKALKLAPEAVTVHTTLAGGGFGRRIETDFALQAAQIARATGATVKLIWSREEDMRHDFYRPAAAVHLRADLDAQGGPLALRFDTACESLLAYSGLGASSYDPKRVDPTGLSAVPPFYQVPGTQLRARTVDAGVPVGYWRSVAASQNCFAYESFVDELALAAGVDPVAYRRRLLKPDARERRVFDTVVARSDWARPAPGRHRGIGIARANGSAVAQVVELSVSAAGAVKLHRITAVVDCGLAVNPNSVRAQVEGGIAFALSAAFYGEITISDGAVEQSNFNDYRLIALADMPPVDVVILDSQEKPGGVGEEAVGPLAPAIANALFAATGRRVRALPLAKAGFTLG